MYYYKQNLKNTIFLITFAIIVTIFLYSLLVVKNNHLLDTRKIYDLKRNDIIGKINELEKEVQAERLELNLLRKTIDNLTLQSNYYQSRDTIIPIVVLVCNRVDALKHLLTKLTRLRPLSKIFPIIVSQDCDSDAIPRMINESFRDDVSYIKHTDPLTDKIDIPSNMYKYKNYYYISRHYKLILDHIFNQLNYETVIILEDDLDISSDFFSYFNATYHQLLKKDQSLYCVSAWNDNGLPDLIDINNFTTLYRTDFFPGLGWMLTKKLWKELSQKWPLGFWDDWIRKPEQRKNRMCIRPEISRTSMTRYGKSGASKGLLFDAFLSRIKLNDIFVNFENIDLSYLTEEKYEQIYTKNVYEYAQNISLDRLKEIINRPVKGVNNFLRVEYSTFKEYQDIAAFLVIMRDFKEGVGRTAYKGVISVYKNGWRIFIAPNKEKWKGYDSKWEYFPR
uniref:Alpha-1,3-mannosyl-glycoprotein 2-beta-N-acetylglucosaminyltransferase n=1 Tax=Parastrongyloides trichosuri TaxID=131310 RepID=A0A0N4ZWY9_PARTI